MSKQLLLSATLLIVGSVLLAALFLSKNERPLLGNDGNNALHSSMPGHRFLRIESSVLDPKSVFMKQVHQQQLAKHGQYQPAEVESFLVDNSLELGFDSVDENDKPSGCDLWKTPTTTHPDVYESLTSYATDLDSYNEAIRNFTPLDIDILDTIRRDQNHNVCSALKLHPDGLPGLFPSNQLSHTQSSGYVEPLAPPFRSHHFCWDRKALMSLDYLVHDFEAMCRNLKPHSKLILIDMGASLSFHGVDDQPIVRLLNLYEKFGFHFDHIYGFEVTYTEPGEVYQNLLPEKYFANYHWINTGVSSGEEDKMNPLRSILSQFSEDDMIVVKLDIDTSSIEVPLARQLLEGGPDGMYHRLIDHFYFEHHVLMKEIKSHRDTRDSMKESLDLFHGLRQRGVASHYWP